MALTGTTTSPLRVAIVGAGPAGFYAADALLKQDEMIVEVDLLDELPTPYGLVRSGVAPDHEKIKNVTRVFDRTADNPRFRFFGNVHFGRHIGLDDLKAHYHQILFTTGAQTDRNLGIPGEGLEGSHSATEFVWWYNGHPAYRDRTFDLSCERVVVVGVGNVAVDVARILCRTPDELATTDIADYALEALRESKIREVVMLGRRGPAQAAFTNPEVKELGEMQDADFIIRPDEAELDALSREDVERADDRLTTKKVELLQDVAARTPEGKSKRIVLRFLVSPTEILDNGAGQVGGVRLVRNELYRTESGRLRPRATDNTEELSCGLVFRSVGYRGVPLPDVPFREDWGTVPNDEGRVLLEPDGSQVPGIYVAGWIKRGPSGVIGTNKADAQETVRHMLEDASSEKHLNPSDPDADAAERVIRQLQPQCFSYADWRRVETLENTAGEAQGRPRVKLTRIEDMLEVLG
ncbi:MAG: FAD-dependent oxidoreductase [Rubricoccaceae bacterium]|nr:FAD-dependent oxidoreductase [Rubricoccaceae bacterium]